MAMRRAFFVATLALAGCAAETVIHDIGEKEANDIVVLLDENDIQAQKQIRDTGREVFYSIAVPGSKRMEAMKILTDHDYPRRPLDGYDKVYEASGLIPTASEEKAKKLRAIEGEIERQLTLIRDVLDAQVNLVMPDESALRTAADAQVPTTASVTVKYLPTKGGIKPLSEQNIRAIVAAGVEKLTPDHVVVVMTEAKPPVTGPGGADCPEVASSPGRGVIGRLSARDQRIAIIAVAVIFILLSGFIVFGQLRLRNVRGRLIRLQNEIAKARRKVPEGLPAPTE
jgi:type III secretion protein J